MNKEQLMKMIEGIESQGSIRYQLIEWSSVKVTTTLAMVNKDISYVEYDFLMDKISDKFQLITKELSW